MNKALNSICLCLLLAFATSSKVQTKDFEVAAFTSVVANWRQLFQKVHHFSDDFFNSLADDEDEVDKDDFYAAINAAFPVDENTISQISDDLLSYWMVDI